MTHPTNLVALAAVARTDSGVPPSPTPANPADVRVNHAVRIGNNLPASSPATPAGRTSPLALAGFHSPLVAQAVAPSTPVEAAFEPVKLFEGIGKGDCDLSCGFAVQPIYLD
jgi:hypothetical protein